MGPDLKCLLIFGFSCAAILVWADQFGVFTILHSNLYTTPAQLGGFVSGIIMFILVLKSTKIQRLTLEKTLAAAEGDTDKQ
jgi:DMSO/TMAO reductase YedYZ heme-binding membrane subunit